MSAALAAIDPAALRPHSDRSSRVLHTETRIHHPVAFHGDVPEIRTVFLLRAARDVESNRLLVTSYTHAGLAFEAEDFASAMRRAVEIVPDFAIGRACSRGDRDRPRRVSLDRRSRPGLRPGEALGRAAPAAA